MLGVWPTNLFRETKKVYKQTSKRNGQEVSFVKPKSMKPTGHYGL